jgi:transcriptional regulator with XRE-family HTH domain
LLTNGLSTDEWKKRLGERVRSVRVASRLTQADVAQRAGISPTSVRMLERGGGSSVKTLIAVTHVLGRTNWLDEFDPRGGAPSPLERLRATRPPVPRPQRVRKPKS